MLSISNPKEMEFFDGYNTTTIQRGATLLSDSMDIESESILMASPKRETALPSLLEKVRKWMFSTATTERTRESGEWSTSLRVRIIWVIPIVEALT
jgi:hypothetical protein